MMCTKLDDLGRRRRLTELMPVNEFNQLVYQNLKLTENYQCKGPLLRNNETFKMAQGPVIGERELMTSFLAL